MGAQPLLSEDLRDLKTYEELKTLGECLGLKTNCSQVELVASIREFIREKLQEKKDREKEVERKQEEDDRIRALYSGNQSDDKTRKNQWEQRNIPDSHVRGDSPEENSGNNGLWSYRRNFWNNLGEDTEDKKNVKLEIKDEESKDTGLWKLPTKPIPVDRSTQTEGEPVNRAFETDSNLGNTSSDSDRHLTTATSRPTYDARLQMQDLVSMYPQSMGAPVTGPPESPQISFQMPNNYQQVYVPGQYAPQGQARSQQSSFQTLNPNNYQHTYVPGAFAGLLGMPNNYQNTYVPGQYAPQGQALSENSSPMSKQQSTSSMSQPQPPSITQYPSFSHTSQPRDASAPSNSSGGDDGEIFSMSM